ncbi:MAG: hypothetical protein K2X34_03455 [Hyphomonadaceae bacterium]|nr:hypothetical protein [Hyphomonadaceae bacterium]
MIRALIAAYATLLCVASATAQAPVRVNDTAIMAARPPATLAAYGFFQDAGARVPSARVTPYDLNTALYSDGALKFRYVYIPEGAQAHYNPDGVFEFPVGTVLIKTFAFADDMRSPGENVRFLETRLLIRRADGWVALPYVWNEAQTEARYSPVGADLPVSFTNEEGQAIALDWHVPNVNECSGCHARNGEVEPIGPSARNLNRLGPIVMPSTPANDPDDERILVCEYGCDQLRVWSFLGILDEAPTPAPRVPNAYDASASLEARARAYLDVNCAHCHNPAGPAHTSGLDLSWSQNDPALWGVLKRPVAAGRGSAGFEYAIEPGHPERSILLHRMQ